MKIYINTRTITRYIKTLCQIDGADQILLQQGTDKLQPSTSTSARIFMVIPTIADLKRNGITEATYISQASQFRRLICN